MGRGAKAVGPLTRPEAKTAWQMRMSSVAVLLYTAMKNTFSTSKTSDRTKKKSQVLYLHGWGNVVGGIGVGNPPLRNGIYHLILGL